MTELHDNILHLPEYEVVGCKSTEDEMHFQVDAHAPPACEECGVSGDLVRMANDALEKMRKGPGKELKLSQSRTLKGDRKILLKRAHEVSDRERLIMETWTGAFPQLLAAYDHKECFYHIWDATTRAQLKQLWMSEQ